MKGKPRDMSIEFAIKVLRSSKVDTPSMHGNPKRYGYQNQTFYDIARNMAIEALKKQTPKRPINIGREIVCPTCRTLVGSSPYCRYCGQMLDHADHPTEKGGVQE